MKLVPVVMSLMLVGCKCSYLTEDVNGDGIIDCGDYVPPASTDDCPDDDLIGAWTITNGAEISDTTSYATATNCRSPGLEYSFEPAGFVTDSATSTTKVWGGLHVMGTVEYRTSSADAWASYDASAIVSSSAVSARNEPGWLYVECESTTITYRWSCFATNYSEEYAFLFVLSATDPNAATLSVTWPEATTSFLHNGTQCSGSDVLTSAPYTLTRMSAVATVDPNIVDPSSGDFASACPEEDTDTGDTDTDAPAPTPPPKPVEGQHNGYSSTYLARLVYEEWLTAPTMQAKHQRVNPLVDMYVQPPYRVPVRGFAHQQINRYYDSMAFMLLVDSVEFSVSFAPNEAAEDQILNHAAELFDTMYYSAQPPGQYPASELVPFNALTPIEY